MAYKWPELDSARQHELLVELTTLLAGSLPLGWFKAALDYRHIGRSLDVSAGVKDAEPDAFRYWDPPADTWRMLQRLRGGMYREGEGTWFSMRYVVEAAGPFTVEYNWRERPDFANFPGPDQFAMDLERFPRGEAHIPEWFREQLASAG